MAVIMTSYETLPVTVVEDEIIVVKGKIWYGSEGVWVRFP